MSTDHELLELAAKAAGISVEWSDEVAEYQTDYGIGFLEPWNPLADDGDCARLCATLGIGTEWAERRVICVCDGYYNYTVFADHNGDKSSAWRKAAVKVAANFGRAMP